MPNKDLIILGLDENLKTEDAIKFLKDMGDWTSKQIEQMKFLVKDIGAEMNEHFKEFRRSLGMVELPGEEIFEELGSDELTDKVISMLSDLKEKVVGITEKPIGATIEQVLEGKTLSDDEFTFFKAILENAKEEFSTSKLGGISEKTKEGKSLSEEDEELLKDIKKFYSEKVEESKYPEPESGEEEEKRKKEMTRFAKEEIERKIGQLISSGIAPYQAKRIGNLFRHWDEDIEFSMAKDEAFEQAKEIILEFKKKQEDKEEVKIFSSSFKPDHSNLAQKIIQLTPKKRG